MELSVQAHYDALIQGGNDPVTDPPSLRDYMDKWDGIPFANALALHGTERVLEIGCGTGRLALRVAPLVRAFCGIDLSAPTIAQARRHLEGIPHVSLIQGDFLHYPFSDSFDLIYASLVFFHLADKEAAFARVSNLLCAGGRFVLSIDKSPSEWLEIGTDRVRLYPDTPDAVLRNGRAAGLNCVKRFEMPFAYGFVFQKEK